MRKTFALVTSASQVAGGVALTVFTGGFGAAAGAALIGSGISSGFSSISGQPEDLTVTSYLKECAIGGVTGLVTGGMSAGGGAVLESLAWNGAKRVTATVGIEAASGALGQVVSRVSRNAAEDKELTDGLTVSDVGIGALTGGLAVGLGQAVTKGVDTAAQRVFGEVVDDTQAVVLTGAKKVIADTLAGGASGAASATTSTLIKNGLSDDKDKKLWDGVGEAAVTGATIGAVVSGLRSKQQQEQQEQQKQSAEKNNQAPKDSEPTEQPSTSTPAIQQADELHSFTKRFTENGRDRYITFVRNPDGTYYAYDAFEFGTDVLSGLSKPESSNPGWGSIPKQGGVGFGQTNVPSKVNTGEPLTRFEMADILHEPFDLSQPSRTRCLSFTERQIENIAIQGGNNEDIVSATIAMRDENGVRFALNTIRPGSQRRYSQPRQEQPVAGATPHGIPGQLPETPLLSSVLFPGLKPQEAELLYEELRSHVVLVHALEHQAIATNYFFDEFYARYGTTGLDDEKSQLEFTLEKGIRQGVIGSFLNFDAARFNPEAKMLVRPQMHWAWNQLVQSNSGGDWEHSRIAILEPLNSFEENSYYAIAPYDTQVNKPHRLSSHSILLLPDNMKPVNEQNLADFQGQVIYYSRNKSLRQAIAETLPQQYPDMWPLVDEQGNPCASRVLRTHPGYLKKTILQRPDGRKMVLFHGANSNLHSSLHEAVTQRKKFIGLHIHSTTYMLESKGNFEVLQKFIDQKDASLLDSPLFLASNQANANALLIKEAFSFYKKMLEYHVPELANYVLCQAIYADFMSLFHQAGFHERPSQAEMLILLNEEKLRELIEILSSIYTSRNADISHYRNSINKCVATASRQRQLPENLNVVMTDVGNQPSGSLFAAVADQTDGMDADTLRTATVCYMQSYEDKYNTNEFEEKGEILTGLGTSSVTYAGFEQYCEQMQTPIAWAGRREAQAIAFALDRPVTIIEPGVDFENHAFDVYNPQGRGIPITLALMYGAYFVALKTREGDVVDHRQLFSVLLQSRREPPLQPQPAINNAFRFMQDRKSANDGDISANLEKFLWAP